MKTIAIHGCYNTSNFGDLLLADMLGRCIQRLGYSAMCPWLLASQKSNVYFDTGNGLSSCLNIDAAVFGGGGYFVDSPTSFRSTLKILRYTVPALMWRLSGRPYAIVGIGVGPHLSALAKLQIRVICDGAKYILARDDESKDLILHAGIAPDKVQVSSDLVFSLTKNDLAQSDIDVAKQLISNKARLKVGLHFPIGDNQGLSAAIDVLLKAVRKHAEMDFYWFYDHGDATREYVSESFKHETNVYVVPKQTHWVTAAFIAQLDGVITTKLHVGITAFTLGVPPCGLSAHAKSKRFYKQIDRMCYQRELGQEFDVLEAWIEKFSDRANPIHHTNAEIRNCLKERAESNYVALQDFLVAHA